MTKDNKAGITTGEWVAKIDPSGWNAPIVNYVLDGVVLKYATFPTEQDAKMFALAGNLTQKYPGGLLELEKRMMDAESNIKEMEFEAMERRADIQDLEKENEKYMSTIDTLESKVKELRKWAENQFRIACDLKAPLGECAVLESVIEKIKAIQNTK